MNIRTIGSTIASSERRRPRTLILSLLVCGFLALAPATAFAEDRGMSTNAGIGVGSAFASLVYVPVKLCYAVGGLVVGGLAWAFSGGDSNVAMVVLTPSVLGDYVVTPGHLTGDQPLEFFGRDPKYTQDNVDVAAAPPEPDYDQAW
jgi:hypothetical protein